MAVKKPATKARIKSKTSAAKQQRSELVAPPRRPSPPRGRQFQKGQSGNPKGRPPVGTSIAELVRKIGDEEDEKKRMARVEVVIRKLFATATVRSQVGIKAAALLIERGWGKATQQIEMTGKDGASLMGTVVFTMPKNNRDGAGVTPVASAPPPQPKLADPAEPSPAIPVADVATPASTSPAVPPSPPPLTPAQIAGTAEVDEDRPRPRYSHGGRDPRVAENIHSLKPIGPDGGPAASTGKR